MNPYQVLGIPTDASATHVKRAYRAAAKKHHPDAGGDPEAFQQVAIAYSVLIDQERRAHFDRTGEVDVKYARNIMAGVIHGLAEMLEMVVAQTKGNMDRLDLIGTLRETARQSAQAWQNKVRGLDAEIRDFEIARKRTKRNDDEKNVFVEIFDAAIRERHTRRKEALHHLEVANRCLEELMAYESEVDVFRSVQGMMFASRSATTGGYFSNVSL